MTQQYLRKLSVAVAPGHRTQVTGAARISHPRAVAEDGDT
jgi:hypothetical protein